MKDFAKEREPQIPQETATRFGVGDASISLDFISQPEDTILQGTAH
jgi:hypothetical protein